MDYTRSHAILLGSWVYDDVELTDVPAARNSFERMAALLRSPACGWPEKSMTLLPDPTEVGDLPDKLVRRFESVEDVALFYFVGHGMVSDDEELCLCVRPTVARRRRTTSLLYGNVRHALMQSHASVKVVIIDCCYSGLATTGPMSLAPETADLEQLTRVHGAVTIAASTPFTRAWAQEPGAGVAWPQTYFTKFFADVVETGIPRKAARLSLNEIFLKVQDRLDEAHKSTPTMRNSDTAANLEFAANLAPPERQRDLEREVADLQSRYDELREELRRLRERAPVAPPPAAVPSPTTEPPANSPPRGGEAREIAYEMRTTEDRLREAVERARGRDGPPAVPRTRSAIADRARVPVPVRGPGRSLGNGPRFWLLRRVPAAAVVLAILFGFVTPFIESIDIYRAAGADIALRDISGAGLVYAGTAHLRTGNSLLLGKAGGQLNPGNTVDIVVDSDYDTYSGAPTVGVPQMVLLGQAATLDKPLAEIRSSAVRETCEAAFQGTGNGLSEFAVDRSTSVTACMRTSQGQLALLGITAGDRSSPVKVCDVVYRVYPG